AELPGPIFVPDPAAIHAELAWETCEPPDVVERCAGAWLEHRQHVHQVEVARVIAIDVVVEAKIPVVIAEVPIARRVNAMDQRAVVEHWQVETATVPAHDLRRVLLDQTKKSLHQPYFTIGFIADAAHAKAGLVAKRAADRHHAMQVMLEEIRADAI